VHIAEAHIPSDPPSGPNARVIPIHVDGMTIGGWAGVPGIVARDAISGRDSSLTNRTSDVPRPRP